MVVGPSRLPKMLGTLGKWVGKARRITHDMRKQSGIDEVLRQEGLAGGLSELRGIVRGDLGALSRVGAMASAPKAAPTSSAQTGSTQSVPAARVDPYDGVADDPLREYPLEGCDSYGALADDLWPDPEAEAAQQAAEAAQQAAEAEVAHADADSESADSESADSESADSESADAAAVGGQPAPASAETDVVDVESPTLLADASAGQSPDAAASDDDVAKTLILAPKTQPVDAEAVDAEAVDAEAVDAEAVDAEAGPPTPLPSVTAPMRAPPPPPSRTGQIPSGPPASTRGQVPPPPPRMPPSRNSAGGALPLPPDLRVPPKTESSIDVLDNPQTQSKGTEA